MGAVGKFIHAPEVVTSVAFTNAFNAGLTIPLPLFADVPGGSSGAGTGKVFLSSLFLLGVIATGATTLTIKAYDNASGTGIAVIPTTVITIDPAITGTNGSCAVKIGVDATLVVSKTLYLFAKTDVGTFTVVRAVLVWEE
jgi:hypothetical protein